MAAYAAVLAFLLGEAFVPGKVLGNLGDVYAYHLPLRHAGAAALQEGRLPLWNPWIFCGEPLAANPQLALWMPMSCLFYVFPALAAFDATWALYLGLAFLGAQLLARRWGLGPTGAFALGGAFALHPFLVYRVPQGIPTHLASLAFVPWVWLAIEDSGLQTPRRLTFLSLVLSLQALSGHPQFMLINLAGLVLFLAVKRPGALAALAAALVPTAALTAVQWIPTLEFLARSVRSHWTPLYAAAYSLAPSCLAALAVPSRLGNPLRPGFTGHPSEFFEMAGLYGGLVPLLLAAWGLARGRRRLAFAALAAAGLFLALGAFNPLLLPLLQRPGLGSLRVPARWVLLTLWALWMAACAGWKRLGRPWLQAAAALMVVLDLARWDRPFLFAQDPAPFVAASPVAETLRRGGQRYATAPETPNPNKGMLYRVPNVTGYEAFYLAGAAWHASRAQGRPSADGSHTYVEDPAAFKDVGLRWYLSEQGLHELKDAQPLVYHEGAKSPDPNAPEFEQKRPERINIVLASQRLSVSASASNGAVRRSDARTLRRSDAQTPLIVAQAFYPGWRAWADSQEIPVEQYQGFLQRVSVPEGAARLHLRFDPGLWAFARWCTLAALAAAGLPWIPRRS